MLERRLHARCGCVAAALSAPRPFALPGTQRVYERPRPFAIEHLALDVTLDPKGKTIEGTAALDVRRIDKSATEIALDAIGFEVRSCEVDGKRVAHVYDGSTLRIPIAPKHAKGTITVSYRAEPRRGLYFLEPDEHVKDRPRQVWSQCQDEDARHWIPCHDKPHVKMTFELRVRVPAGWYALSNGALVSADKKGAKTWRYHWKMDDPVPSYLVTLAAGEFSELDGGAADGVPLTYLVPKGREKDGKRTFARTPAMIEHFGRVTGVKFPWNKYAQIVVSDFIFGGMENTTATTMYEHILLDERAALDITSDDLIAHELAHQWFGDFVTCRDFSHGWLNEGFATFFEHIDREAKLGRDEYEYGLKADLDAYLGEANGRYKRPIVCADYEEPIDIFDRHLYEKGGLVLHMLRTTLGDETFFGGVKTYLERHARGVVETRDLHRALEEVSGRGLDRFFEQWLHRPGHPELEVKIEHEDRVLSITVKQTQKPGDATKEPTVPTFAFDLVFDVVGEGGKVRRETRHIDEQTQTIAIACPERPRFVVVDPELAVLADVRLEAPLDMLRNQLAEAKTARGRWLACAPLGKKIDAPGLGALAATLANEKEFWGVRVEAAAALAESRLEAGFQALEKALKTRHPKVRRAIVHGLGKFRTPAAAQAIAKRALADESYLVEAEAARALGGTRQTSAFDTLVEVLDRPSWADVIRVGALDGLAALRDDRAVPHVLARTKYGVSTRGRRAAIMALPKLSTDRKIREAIEELLEDADPYLRVDVVRALAEIGDAKSRGPLSRQLERDLDGRVRRRIREVLRDLGTGSRAEHERLRDEVEKLRTEHAELVAKVAKLEAAVKRK